MKLDLDLRHHGSIFLLSTYLQQQLAACSNRFASLSRYSVRKTIAFIGEELLWRPRPFAGLQEEKAV